MSVEHLGEWLLSTPEDLGSNPAVSNFHINIYLLFGNDENKAKEAGKVPFFFKKIGIISKIVICFNFHEAVPIAPIGM